MTSPIHIILCSEWKYKGFAHAIKQHWTDNKGIIIGSQSLENNFKTILSTAETTSKVFVYAIESYNTAFYKSIQSLQSSLTVPSVFSLLMVEDYPEHWKPNTSIHWDTTIDIRTYTKERQTLPIDPTIWQQTNKIRFTKTGKPKPFNTKPKQFPILTAQILLRDVNYLKRVSKYPFVGIQDIWDSQVINYICKEGCVGITFNNSNDQSFVRSFWNTYGVLVLEDITFKQPDPAKTIDFIKLLSQKNGLLVGSANNIEHTIDLKQEQATWADCFKSNNPNSSSIDSTSIPIKNSQLMSRNNHIKQVKLIKEGDKQARLPLPDIEPSKLPCVSVCTITRNHRSVFPFVVNSLAQQSYPLDKIEWVILQNGSEEIQDLIPKHLKKSLKNIHIETIPEDHGLSIPELRNKVIEHSTEPFIAFMDDDDIYFHTSLLARIKTLIKYNLDCVGCTEIGSYHLIQEKGGIASDGKHLFAEATLAFRRKFWEERPFLSTEKMGEARGFLMGRQSACISIPYHFVILAMTHGSNTTGDSRMIDGKELIPLKELLSEEELSLVESSVKYFKQRYRVVKNKSS